MFIRVAPYHSEEETVAMADVAVGNWNNRDMRKVIVDQPRGDTNRNVQTTSILPIMNQPLPIEIALYSKPHECECYGCLRCCFESCCVRFDCASEMSLFQAISRYEEEFMLPVETYITLLKSNQFLISILESLYHSHPDFFFTYLPTGSLREGFGKMLPSTSVLATDHDIMLVPDGVIISELGADCGNETPVFSIIDAPTEHSPGFLWLKLEDKYLTQWEKLCLRRHVENEGCSLLSSSIWRETIRKTLENTMDLRMKAHIDRNLNTDDIIIKVTNSGPALTIEIIALRNGNFISKNDEQLIFHADFTLGLHCKSWPQKAQEYFTSPFRKNWPPRSIVERISKLGCHVVPKSSTNQLIKLSLGQTESTTFGQSPGLEWRYSFSQAEIIMSRCIPAPAKTAYLAFKAMVKRHLNKIESQGKIPSYALKCIMFSVVEEKKADYWRMKPAIVERIFLEMLHKLEEYLRVEFCPNYWIKEINLFNFTSYQFVSKRAMLSNILKNPKMYVANEWLEYTRYVRGEIKQVIYQILGDPEKEENCVWCRISCKEDNDGFSSTEWLTDPLSLDVY